MVNTTRGLPLYRIQRSVKYASTPMEAGLSLYMYYANRQQLKRAWSWYIYGGLQIYWCKNEVHCSSYPTVKQMVLTQTGDMHTLHSIATIISHRLSHTVVIGWWCSYLMTRWEVYHFLLSVFRFLWLRGWMGEWHPSTTTSKIID